MTTKTTIQPRRLTITINGHSTVTFDRQFNTVEIKRNGGVLCTHIVNRDYTLRQFSELCERVAVENQN